MAVGKRCAASTWPSGPVRSSPSSGRTLSPGADPLSSTSVTTSLITSCHRRFLVISGSSATRWNVATVANSLAVRPSGGARTWTVVGEDRLGADREERPGTGLRPPAAGDLLLQLHHPHVALGCC